MNAAFETVPLQEHLIAGIATVASPYTLLPVFVATLAYVQGREAEHRVSTPPAAAGDHSISVPAWIGKPLIWTANCALIVTFLVIPWDTAVTIGVGLLAMVAGAILCVRSGVRVAHTLPLVSMIGIFVMLGGGAYFHGPPPDNAAARLRSGHAMAASYLGTTGGYMYLGQSRRVLAIPTEEVESVAISKPAARNVPESLFQLVTGLRIGP